ncbi:fliH protein [Arenibaculum sp.]|uniref:fliH protein n=1 Tax=Arenibaculum sp. TaxID=2865862 RepID=UPI002E0F8EB1|nr:fliH protein [Arenibaculum sp.]
MMGYPRYAFDLRFDAASPGLPAAGPPVFAPGGPGPVVAADPDPPDPPVHTDDALRAAAAEAEARGFAAGFEAGRADGIAAATAGAQAEAAAALTVLKAALRRIARRMESVTAAMEADAAAVMAALVRRMAPGLAALGAGPAMERLAAEALRAARTSPVLDIRVRPEAAASLQAHLAGLACADGFAGRLAVTGDPALGRGAIRAEWAAGSLTHDPSTVEAAIAALAERALDAVRVEIVTETHRNDHA